ncbi:unnamed protein product [Taenia asiatica]|uniref:Uncharacterized protein n=1 Tax=Taenia asiatica TaxID=60517 RepID=A0A0R3WGD5_TAEAS|nr:unnamed protein product [Taenia asiatica]
MFEGAPSGSAEHEVWSVSSSNVGVPPTSTVSETACGNGGVVWCGVVWCGVVWCGVVWCGVVWLHLVRMRGLHGFATGEFNSMVEGGSILQCSTPNAVVG